MSSVSYSSGLTEVNEIILLTSSHTMSVPASTGSQVDSVSHNFGFAPYIEYMFSLDGGLTFVPPHLGLTFNSSDPNIHFVSAYTDSTKAYFNFSSQSTPLALTIVINYKLFRTEKP